MQVHTVEVEATVKVKVKFTNVLEGESIQHLKEGARIAAEKIIGAGLRKCHGYRGLNNDQLEPSIKEILDTSASTISIGKILVDL